MHEHDWQPIPNESGVYRCNGCDALGRRDLRTGKILLAKRPVSPWIDTKPLTWGGGRIAKKPDADHQGLSAP